MVPLQCDIQYHIADTRQPGFLINPISLTNSYSIFLQYFFVSSKTIALTAGISLRSIRCTRSYTVRHPYIIIFFTLRNKPTANRLRANVHTTTRLKVFCLIRKYRNVRFRQKRPNRMEIETILQSAEMFSCARLVCCDHAESRGGRVRDTASRIKNA